MDKQRQGFYSRSMNSWLEKNATEMSIQNKVKSVVA